MAKIGFIGLGNMGGGMAANLARAGQVVNVFDLSEEALWRASDAGCTPASSAVAAVNGAECIVTMLPAGAHVEQVYTEIVFPTVAAGTLLIDCSTIDVVTARRVADAAHERGLLVVDAPVSGGVGAAAAGTLTFMVGGGVEEFDRARPLLLDMGRTVIHAGGNGTGQVAKACNNMVLAATMVATCEAFAMADRLGLDASIFYDIASKATAQSWSLTSYCPVPGVGPKSPADDGYRGGFAADLMLKDLRLAASAAAEAGAETPMSDRARTLYETFHDDGHGSLDFSAIIRTFTGRR